MGHQKLPWPIMPQPGDCGPWADTAPTAPAAMAMAVAIAKPSLSILDIMIGSPRWHTRRMHASTKASARQWLRLD
jgi:hypothetical protein